jgi:hypothetical protein
MAESKNNVVTHGLSGKIDLLVFRQKNGKTLVAKAPKERTIITAAQQQVQEKFQQAVIYAKTALSDAAIKADYNQKTGNGLSAYNIAIADYFNAPNIQEIDVSVYTGQIGSKIIIKVTDDFKVSSVHVQISNSDGSLVEEGEAVQDANGISWIFTATQANASLIGDKIMITAFDMPGNDAIQEKTLS